MRCARLITAVLVLLGGVAEAAEGDRLAVDGTGVNVRAQPQAGAPVLLQVDRPEPAIELAREGEWVRVRLPDRGAEGWIHGSLLSAGGGEPPPASGGPSSAALERFRESVEILNTRALAAAGVDLFTEVRMADADVAQVVTTEAWDVVPESGRQSFMNALHDRWLAAVGSPLGSLQIVDRSGRLLSEKTAP